MNCSGEKSVSLERRWRINGLGKLTKAFTILERIRAQVIAQGGTPDGFEAFIDKYENELVEEATGAILRKTTKMEVSRIYRIPKNTRSLKQLVRAGKYDDVYEEITNNKGRWLHISNLGSYEPTITKNQEYEMVLLRAPTRHVEYADLVNMVVCDLGMQPCGLEGILQFGAHYPDIQREFTIVGLASLILTTCEEVLSRECPALWTYTDSGERILTTTPVDKDCKGYADLPDWREMRILAYLCK